MKLTGAALCVFAVVLSGTSGQYTPDWKSLDSRPLPGWFDDAKIGIFLHWGVFSVPSFGSEWFWNFWKEQKKQPYIDFMKNNFKPGFTYQDFASKFTAEFYNPDQWADIFNASGARYIVLTSKHHEGFTLWPSKVSWSWNAQDVGPKRDLLGDLATAVRKYPKLHFGLYHSLFEWFNPIYKRDMANGYHTKDFPMMKTIPELYEIVMRYKPELIWSDGAPAHSDYFTSKDFLAWLYNESPVKDIVVVNDRWGNDTDCKHGGYYSCMDRYNPGKLVNHKWENAMTLDQSSWGFRRDATLKDIMKIEDLISLLTETVSCGGNLLVNIGPTHDGRVVPIFEERLRQMGSWLGVNGEGIYGTQPWAFQNDTITPGIWYTAKGDHVYAFVLNWPKDNIVRLGRLTKLTPKSTLSLLGVPGKLIWKKGPKGEAQIQFPLLTPDIVPCQWAWTIKIQMSPSDY